MEKVTYPACSPSVKKSLEKMVFPWIIVPAEDREVLFWTMEIREGVVHVYPWFQKKGSEIESGTKVCVGHLPRRVVSLDEVIDAEFLPRSEYGEALCYPLVFVDEMNSCLVGAINSL